MEKKKTKEQKQIEKSKIENKENLVGTRGRIFQGKVIRKFPTRVTIEFERTVYIHKYERYMVKKTRLHARLPSNINAEIGDLIKIQECRPLSKIIHFIVINIVNKAAENKEAKK